ncbi:MAG: type II toxin-antitoxin system RelB/DinJ family antitoxin [Lachnospiraceae bacterium]
MAKTFLQVRTEDKVKEQASLIVEELGTNLSSVVNMLLKQIILTKSIPFEVKLPQTYTEEEAIAEVKATMAMEHMPLTTEDVDLLRLYRTSQDKDEIRNQLLADYLEV